MSKDKAETIIEKIKNLRKKVEKSEIYKIEKTDKIILLQTKILLEKILKYFEKINK